MSPSIANCGTGESTSRSSIKRRATPFVLQLGAHLPKERYAYTARKSFAKFRYSYNWLSPDLPCSNPNGSSIPQGTRPVGPKSDPEWAGTRLQQSRTTVWACVIHQRTGDQTAQSINLPVIAFPMEGVTSTVHPSDMSDSVDVHLSL